MYFASEGERGSNSVENGLNRAYQNNSGNRQRDGPLMPLLLV